MDDDHRADLRQLTERWFVRRGVPHFIHDYNATGDIFTRAAPVLGLVFFLELLNGLNQNFTWWQNVLALLGATAIAVVGLVTVNRLHGRRPFRRPDTIGAIEIAGFVLVPPVVPLVFGGQVKQAVLTLAGNVLFVAVVYFVTSYGVVPMTRWATGQMFSQLRNLANLLVRSLPLLLLFTMFMFFNAELWKITDDLPTQLYWCSVAVLVIVGFSFIALRVPRELAGVSQFESWRSVREAAEGTPLANFDADADADADATPTRSPLERRARLNVALVLVVSQSIQILLVTAAIFGFYVLFGMFTIVDTTIHQWTGTKDLEVMARFDFIGVPIVVTWELMRTAFFIASVAGLQFTVAALTDNTYREEFYEEINNDLHQAFAVREIYLKTVIEGDVAYEAAG